MLLKARRHALQLTVELLVVFSLALAVSHYLSSHVGRSPGLVAGAAVDLGVVLLVSVPFMVWRLGRAVDAAAGAASRQARLAAANEAGEREQRDRNAVRAAIEEATGAADAANRSKSEFLANMSHEIRTPLTSILGFTDVLMEEGGASLAPEERRQTLATIRAAGTHLLALINDILDLSKIEAGRMSVECVETSLPEVLRDVCGILGPRCRGKGVTFEVKIASELPAMIRTDPTRLRQILMNLVGNAVKFTEEGSVGVEVRAECTGASSWLVIEVADTGPGITAKQASHLFQSFTQADTTVTRRHGGTGLGLIICRRLALLMEGGVVLARSEVGKGSTFRLELPLVPVAGSPVFSCLESGPGVAAPARGAPAPAQARLAGRVLFAEDGADNQRLIAYHLRKAGATVDLAENGRIALEAMEASEARGEPYDLLLSDMQMPEMDGYTLARTLRGMGSRTPIIALTAHAMADDRRKCLESGCDDFVSKPVDKARLLETCAAWLGRARCRAAA